MFHKVHLRIMIHDKICSSSFLLLSSNRVAENRIYSVVYKKHNNLKNTKLGIQYQSSTTLGQYPVSITLSLYGFFNCFFFMYLIVKSINGYILIVYNCIIYKQNSAAICLQFPPLILTLTWECLNGQFDKLTSEMKIDTKYL